MIMFPHFCCSQSDLLNKTQQEEVEAAALLTGPRHCLRSSLKTVPCTDRWRCHEIDFTKNWKNGKKLEKLETWKNETSFTSPQKLSHFLKSQRADCLQHPVRHLTRLFLRAAGHDPGMHINAYVKMSACMCKCIRKTNIYIYMYIYIYDIYTYICTVYYIYIYIYLSHEGMYVAM